jgi:hypothetical protein
MFVIFPSDWNITHSENHWVNTATQMDYVKNIILPYIRKVRRTQNLSKSQMTLCIFDVFRAQMGEDFLDFLSENNIKVVYVPACCTDRLQLLDVSVQKAVKNFDNGTLSSRLSAKVLLIPVSRNPLRTISGLFLMCWTILTNHFADNGFSRVKERSTIKVVYVPACCTDRLQLLDVSVQKAVKNHLRQSFEDCYADEIVKQLNENKGSDSGIIFWT